jgi:hypothetical protein
MGPLFISDKTIKIGRRGELPTNELPFLVLGLLWQHSKLKLGVILEKPSGWSLIFCKELGQS